MNRKVNFDIITKNYPLKTNWLFFYIFVRFPIGIAFSIMTIISSFSLLKTESNTAETESNIVVVILMINIIETLLNIVLFNKLRRLTPDGYKFNKTMLFISPFILSISIFSFYNTSGNNALYSYVISTVLLLLFWTLPNYTYFNNRKDLFVEYRFDKHGYPILVWEKDIVEPIAEINYNEFSILSMTNEEYRNTHTKK